jgi:uncharacterized protein
MSVKKLIPVLMFIIILQGCGNNLSPEQEEYINSIEKFRKEKDDYMKNDPNSPFNQDPNAEFRKLNYFDTDTAFKFESRLIQFPEKDTVIVLGTKGEERETIRFGYVVFDYEGKSYNINVYQGKSRTGTEYYSIWFTDRTTGEETYGVGRYIDFEYMPDTSHIYTIDFNLAYNPYCAYSSKYSCAIPTKEDHLDLAIRAGEKNFH